MTRHGVDLVDDITAKIDAALAEALEFGQQTGGGCDDPDCDCAAMRETVDRSIEPTNYSGRGLAEAATEWEDITPYVTRVEVSAETFDRAWRAVSEPGRSTDGFVGSFDDPPAQVSWPSHPSVGLLVGGAHDGRTFAISAPTETVYAANLDPARADWTPDGPSPTVPAIDVVCYRRRLIAHHLDLAVYSADEIGDDEVYLRAAMHAAYRPENVIVTGGPWGSGGDWAVRVVV